MTHFSYLNKDDLPVAQLLGDIPRKHNITTTEQENPDTDEEEGRVTKCKSVKGAVVASYPATTAVINVLLTSCVADTLSINQLK